MYKLSEVKIVESDIKFIFFYWSDKSSANFCYQMPCMYMTCHFVNLFNIKSSVYYTKATILRPEKINLMNDFGKMTCVLPLKTTANMF